MFLRSLCGLCAFACLLVFASIGQAGECKQGVCRVPVAAVVAAPVHAVERVEQAAERLVAKVKHRKHRPAARLVGRWLGR